MYLWYQRAGLCNLQHLDPNHNSVFIWISASRGEDWDKRTGEREREKRADLNGETVRLGVIHRDEEHGVRLGLVGQLKQSRDITAGNLGPVRLSAGRTIFPIYRRSSYYWKYLVGIIYFLLVPTSYYRLLLLLILTNLFMIVCCWEELRVCRDVTKFKSSSQRTSLEDILDPGVFTQ